MVVKISDAEWVVCYDMTEEAKQIRFVNWSGKEVSLNSATFQPVNNETTESQSQESQSETETQTAKEMQSEKSTEPASVLGVKVKKVKGFQNYRL